MLLNSAVLMLSRGRAARAATRSSTTRRGAKHTRGPRVARMRATAAGADVQYARRGATYAP
ncbi:hypothetical protein BURPS668_1881 [Burkholderia pseudomallei 668]|nr:hypothetical protein BURPS668_1881 [Burkholderia pseudomallei 668]